MNNGKKNRTLRATEQDEIIIEMLRGLNINLETLTGILREWVKGTISPGQFRDMVNRYIDDRTEGKF
jgi:hypothetical protein